MERSEDRGPSSPANEAYWFFQTTANQAHDPSALLVRMHTMGGAHYHGADEFQIVVDGKGKLGRHELTPVSVHFARAYTPYGPLQPDKERGWGFLTLRVRINPVGTQRLPASAEKLKQIPNRKPWQASTRVSFDREGFSDVPALRNEEGLFAQTLKLAPGASATFPTAAGGDGQYLVITKGSLMHEGKEHRALAVMFLRDDEGAYTAHAGSSGLEALVLNFPKPLHTPVNRLQTMSCTLCSFTYDQALGLPADGIREGTPWEEIPETWTCPDCGAGKKDFEEIDL